MYRNSPDPKSLRILMVLIFLWGVFGLVVSAHAQTALNPPGFDNQAVWKEAVRAVIDKDDAATLKAILKVGDGPLGGYFSTNYSHFLSEIARKKTRLFLRVAADHYKNDMEKALPYLVNEVSGLPPALERAMTKVPKSAPEYALAQGFLRAARGKAASLGKE